MEGQVASPVKPGRAKADHLMCGTPLWGLAGFVLSAYFSYRSYWHVANGAYAWPHTAWTVVTYGIWAVLIVGLLTETRCLRERVFLGLVLLAFLPGLAFSAWFRAPESMVHQVRIAVMVLWSLAALASLTTLRGRTETSSSQGKD
jgi:hypothetical protein